MTDQTSNVGNQPDSGAGGATNPPASSQASSPVAVDADLLSKLVRETIQSELKPVKGEISGLYSRQDKDRNALREFMDEVKKQQAKGLSDEAAFDAAQSEIKKRDEAEQEKKMLKEIHSKLFGASSEQPAGNGTNGAVEKAKVVLDELKLDANSPDVVSILARGLDPEKQELELRRYASRPRPQPSAAEAASIPTGGNNRIDVDALNNELQDLARNPSRNMKRINEIGEILKKAA